MKDRKNESLSALCDGECDELEVRRVLNQLSSDSELREQWQRYHLLGSIMRDESASSVDLSEGIMQALDGEPMDDVPAFVQHSTEAAVAQGTQSHESKKSAYHWLMSSAVAASVTLAVLVGARFAYDPSALNEPKDGQILVQSDVQSEQVVAVHEPAAVAAVSPTAVTSDVSAEELRKAQEMLSQYVLEHENEVINAYEQTAPPFVRVANFGSDSKAAIRKD